MPHLGFEKKVIDCYFKPLLLGGGDARETVKALLVANEFLNRQISLDYTRGVNHGQFNCYSG